MTVQLIHHGSLILSFTVTLNIQQIKQLFGNVQSNNGPNYHQCPQLDTDR